MIVGHEAIVRRALAERPPVSLFLGPRSVGKETVAEHLLVEWGVDPGDTLRVEALNVFSARMLLHFASTAATHDRKAAIVHLHGAPSAAIHILLKTLEEAHESTDFILIAEEAPIATIMTRAVVYRFGLLTEAEVATILEGRNFRPEDALRYARASRGQVSEALAIANGREAKHVVMLAVKAFRELDAAALEEAAREWTDQHTALFATWCRESLTERPRIFSAEEVFPRGVLPLRILRALGTNTRPRLLLRGPVMAVLRSA